MELVHPAFREEVKAIAYTKDTDVNYFWYAKVHAGGTVVLPITVLSIDIKGDYVNNYADDMVVKMSFGFGTYTADILPYKQDLKVTLIRRALGAYADGEYLGDEIVEETFRATIINQAQENTTANPATTYDKDAADLVAIQQVYFQLQDLALEQIRLQSFGSSFRQVVPGDVLKSIITRTSQAVVLDDAHVIKGVEMYEYHNTEVFDHVIIPHATPVVDIPDYIQGKAGGVYSTGLGFYLFKHHWYIWPLYDLKRIDKVVKTITIIILPPNQLHGIERTFRTTANQLILLATGGAKHIDTTEQSLQNSGNGVRFSDPRKLMHGFASTTGNKSVATRASNNKEFSAIERGSGLNNVRKAESGSTRNIYSEASKLASRAGSYMMVNWQNSNPDYIIPNTPVEVMYIKDDLPVSLNATLVGVETFISGIRPGATNAKHQCHSVIKLFVEKDLPEYAEYISGNGVDQYTASDRL